MVRKWFKSGHKVHPSPAQLISSNGFWIAETSPRIIRKRKISQTSNVGRIWRKWSIFHCNSPEGKRGKLHCFGFAQRSIGCRRDRFKRGWAGAKSTIYSYSSATAPDRWMGIVEDGSSHFLLMSNVSGYIPSDVLYGLYRNAYRALKSGG